MLRVSLQKTTAFCLSPIAFSGKAAAIYCSHPFVTVKGNGRGQSNAYIDEGKVQDVGMDIFRRGLCLPSDNKMTPEQQYQIIEIIRRCIL